MWEDDAPGVCAHVHRSLLEPILALGVPYMSAVANLFHTIILMTLSGRLRYVVVGLLVHVGLALLIRGDQYRLTIIYRYFGYAPSYPPRP